MPKVNILRDYKLLRKFCERRNKDYGCAELFDCKAPCPIGEAVDQLEGLTHQGKLKKFCKKFDLKWNCTSGFGCVHQICPLNHLNETEYLMNQKNLSLGHAYQGAERTSPTEEWAKEILREKMVKAKENLEKK